MRRELFLWVTNYWWVTNYDVVRVVFSADLMLLANMCYELYKWVTNYCTCVAVWCSVLQCVAGCCRVLQLVVLLLNVLLSVYCSVLQFFSVFCSTNPSSFCCSQLQSFAVFCSWLFHYFWRTCVFLFDAVCCSLLQSLAVSCSLLQSVAVSCFITVEACVCVFVTVCSSVLQYVAECSVCYSMLQSVDSLLLKGTPIQCTSLPIMSNSYLSRIDIFGFSVFLGHLKRRKRQFGALVANWYCWLFPNPDFRWTVNLKTWRFFFQTNHLRRKSPWQFAWRCSKTRCRRLWTSSYLVPSSWLLVWRYFVIKWCRLWSSSCLR